MIQAAYLEFLNSLSTCPIQEILCQKQIVKQKHQQREPVGDWIWDLICDEIFWCFEQTKIKPPLLHINTMQMLKLKTTITIKIENQAIKLMIKQDNVCKRKNCKTVPINAALDSWEGKFLKFCTLEKVIIESFRGNQQRSPQNHAQSHIKPEWQPPGEHVSLIS